jgi:dTDP-4-dehydrorhamnose reductase
MRVAITGADGQLGRALQADKAAPAEIIPVDLPDWDITDPQVTARLAAVQPELVIHCAALTDVDGCARDPDQAFRVNALGTQNVALACQRAGAALIYISTNEVFDGTAARPYIEFDTPNPINPYGASKLAGETIAARLLHTLYIVRIAWLFAPGSRSFVSKILARAEQQGHLRVVTDEVASPTYAPDLAAAVWQLAATGHYGIYHLVNEGLCSRYEYAIEILRQAGRSDIPVEPITRDQFERPSRPPAYAPLRNTVAATLGIRLQPWQEALRDCFSHMHS